MYKKVVLKAFNKAESEIPGKTTKTLISEHISTVLLDDFKSPVSGRKLRDLFNDAKSKNENEDINIKSEYVQDLCKYLGFENYAAFLRAHPEKEDLNNKKGITEFIKKNKAALLIGLIAIIVIMFAISFNKQRWMVWEETNYVEVEFDSEKYSLSQLKIYNQERIENFHKIIPNCQTLFFMNDGEANLWYGKNIKGELEYFTALAKHPESGKTLKAITKYMIKTHICDSYD